MNDASGRITTSARSGIMLSIAMRMISSERNRTCLALVRRSGNGGMTPRSTPITASAPFSLRIFTGTDSTVPPSM